MRSCRPRGPGKAFKNVGGFAPHIFEGFPGPPGPARHQKRTQKTRPVGFPRRGQVAPPPTSLHFCTLGFLIHGVWAGRKSSIFGVWAAPAAPKTIPKGGGLRPPPFGMVFGASGAAQTPNIDDSRPAQKPCIKNPTVKSVQQPRYVVPCGTAWEASVSLKPRSPTISGCGRHPMSETLQQQRPTYKIQ